MHFHGISSAHLQSALHGPRETTAAMAARRAEVTRRRLLREGMKAGEGAFLSDDEACVVRISSQQDQSQGQSRDAEEESFEEVLVKQFSARA